MKNFLLNLAVTLVESGSTVDVKGLEADAVLHNGLNIVYTLAGIVAVIVIIVGGIMYTTSAGEAGNITKAKNLILYAVIGLGVVIAAYAITAFVMRSF